MHEESLRELSPASSELVELGDLDELTRHVNHLMAREEWDELARDNPCPETYTVRTPRGGLHLYFRGSLPPYVAIPRNPSFTWELGKSAYLGGRYESFKVGDPNEANFKVQDLTPAEPITGSIRIHVPMPSKSAQA